MLDPHHTHTKTYTSTVHTPGLYTPTIIYTHACYNYYTLMHTVHTLYTHFMHAQIILICMHLNICYGHTRILSYTCVRACSHYNYNIYYICSIKYLPSLCLCCRMSSSHCKESACGEG